MPIIIERLWVMLASDCYYLSPCRWCCSWSGWVLGWSTHFRSSHLHRRWLCARPSSYCSSSTRCKACVMLSTTWHDQSLTAHSWQMVSLPLDPIFANLLLKRCLINATCIYLQTFIDILKGKSGLQILVYDDYIFALESSLSQPLNRNQTSFCLSILWSGEFYAVSVGKDRKCLRCLFRKDTERVY